MQEGLAPTVADETHKAEAKRDMLSYNQSPLFFSTRGLLPPLRSGRLAHLLPLAPGRCVHPIRSDEVGVRERPLW